MLDVANALADLLSKVQRPGGFHATGTFDIHPPRLEVDGVGPIALPLLPIQAEQLAKVAEQAPYGRGSETLVDTAVRRTWQVDAARVHIGGRRWAEDLATVVARVRLGLGVAGQVEAELYKLLVYDTGGFFVTHRDTEKAPGMFATLVIVLPCAYSGGELLIRHKDQEVRIDLHRNEPSEAAFAAFYADCRHEVLPIASGHRLALVYNLLRVGTGPLPLPPDYDAEQREIEELLQGWANSDGGPAKLVYPLEHAYTEAELGFATLKGVDAAVAGVAVAAAREAVCDLHLALLTIAESGWAEYTGGGRRGSPELEIGEVEASSWTIHDWRRPDGGRLAMGPLRFDEAEVSPPGAFADLDDTEPDFQEATGNEGASFERFYQRAALVLWPQTWRPKILAAGGLDVSIPALMDLVREWESADAPSADGLRQEAQALAAAIRAAWPQGAWERKRASEAGHPVSLLAALLRLGDLEGCANFIAQQTVAGAYGAADNAALALVLGQLPADRAADLLTAVIATNSAHQPGACASLLARCTQGQGDRLATLRTPALALLAGLPGGREAPPATDGGRPEPLAPALAVDTLSALDHIDEVLAGQAVARFLSCPKFYDMDALLLPAALALKESLQGAEPAADAALRRAVLAHLERRIAKALEPPADWIRDADIACTCPHCLGLSRFLASPTEPVWPFRAAQAQRDHVTQSVTRQRCDLDLRTDKRGSPYTLVCTKNQASFDRRVRQRELDLAHRRRLAD